MSLGRYGPYGAVPPGLHGIHPSWIEAALEGLPPRARTALTSPATPMDVWLARWATAELPPMTDPVLPLDPAWLVGVGADQLAFALGPAAARVPKLAAASARIAKPPRLGQLGPQRAAIARCKDVSLDDDLALARVACRAIAPHVATDRIAQLQLTRSMPRPVGLVLESELLAHAEVALDQVPAWAALVGRS